MPITATCGKCGKGLKVRDELIGKNIRCPGCGNSFKAEASSVMPAASLSSASKVDPKAKKSAPAFHMSPMWIAWAVMAISIPTILILWFMGPGAVRKQWAEQQPVAESAVEDVINRALEIKAEEADPEHLRASRAAPKVMEVHFFFSEFAFSMPEKVGFVGSCSSGAVSGFYHFTSGQVEADVEMGGLSFAGTGVLRRGNSKMAVAGTSKDGNVKITIDGKPAEMPAIKPDEKESEPATKPAK
jgi:hypothetical protein